ncbi:MAG: P1 family peptidase, partial [Thermodesulfobacteriota bacterium]
AGARKSKRSCQFAHSSEWIKRGVTHKQFGVPGLTDASPFNTTLGVIATNADLSKKEVQQVAQIAHSGLAKVISPFHTTFDGDLIFAISLGKKKSNVNTVGLLGEQALIRSVERAVTQADGLGVIPGYRDITALKKKV